MTEQHVESFSLRTALRDSAKRACLDCASAGQRLEVISFISLATLSLLHFVTSSFRCCLLFAAWVSAYPSLPFPTGFLCKSCVVSSFRVTPSPATIVLYPRHPTLWIEYDSSLKFSFVLFVYVCATPPSRLRNDSKLSSIHLQDMPTLSLSF